MNLLQELLVEARDEMLQEAWDRCLLTAFRSTKYPLTAPLVDTFRETHKLSKEAFHELKRVPRYSRHFQTRIPRFIAAYLPALNDRLYDSKMTDDELIVWMRKVNLDTENKPSDMYKSNAEFRVKQKSARELAINKVEWMAKSDSRQSFGRKWSTVKPVRSK